EARDPVLRAAAPARRAAPAGRHRAAVRYSRRAAPRTARRKPCRAPRPGAAGGRAARGAAVMVTLRADSITKRFGGLTALDKVSLELAPGEIHGLIGPNGSGKTTLLNLLSGYYEADDGEVQLGSESLTHAPVQRRAALGVARTFQTPRLLGSL